MFEVSEKATEMIKEAIRNQEETSSIRVVFNEGG
jgi:Fe-S cluster assembly iron-binding protein IscA